MAWAVATVAIVAMAASSGDAREVAVPVRLDHEFVRRLLLAQVYTEPEQSVRIWDDDSGCNFLRLADPKVDSSET
ncbi:MAG TPA: hypothetical protein VFF43_23190, partial [Caldimonas sp.]|nr:hypothetical protein [Caldimonas sp.]